MNLINNFRGDLSVTTVVTMIILLATLVVLLFIIGNKFTFLQNMWSGFFRG